MRVFSLGSAALSQAGAASTPKAPTVAVLARVRKLRRFMGQPAQPEVTWFSFIDAFGYSVWLQELLAAWETPGAAANLAQDRLHGAARRSEVWLLLRLTAASILHGNAASSLGIRRGPPPLFVYCLQSQTTPAPPPRP